ncbi:hypothetical protein BaRGS_00021671, partial [Batillaria attramentaria]
MSSAENSASADGSDCLSMVDVLAEQARLQEDASAVLGDSDEVNCTYAKGYVQRQALYACTTCCTTEPAGICLACSYRCHEGHDLYELYTKRFFRCDCGNSKFQDTKCKLTPTKEPVNPENQYNQNFRGRYCTCSRPYPDPDDEVDDEMIQCVICEDWYHGRHLNAAVPDNEDYQEMICSGCIEKHTFLSAYHVRSTAVTIKSESGSEQQKVEVGTEGQQKQEPVAGTTTPSLNGLVKEEKEVSETKVTSQQRTGASDADGRNKRHSEEVSGGQGEDPAQVSRVVMTKEQGAGGADGKPAESDDCQPPAKRLKTEKKELENSEEGADVEHCLLQDLKQREVTAIRSGTFWPAGWRAKLCRCAKCMSMYEEEGVQFLLDDNDTVHAYEERGRSKTPTVTDSELERNALSQMNRIQQVEVLQGFMDLKTELREFLKGFADSGK